jgi:hypothetical protein
MTRPARKAGAIVPIQLIDVAKPSNLTARQKKKGGGNLLFRFGATVPDGISLFYF